MKGGQVTVVAEANEVRQRLMTMLQNGQSPDSVETFKDLDLELRQKYRYLPLRELIRDNSDSHGWIPKLLKGLELIRRYALVLLKPESERPARWRSIPLDKHIVHTILGNLKGGKGVLKQLGYTDEGENEMCFPEDAAPNQQEVAGLAAEILLAKPELIAYLCDAHPKQTEFSETVPEFYRPHTLARVVYQEPETVSSPEDAANVRQELTMNLMNGMAPTAPPEFHHYNLPLTEKYKHLKLGQLISKNSNDGKWLPRLISALEIMRRFGMILLKPPAQRPGQWRTILFSNRIFTENFKFIDGHRDILVQFGYTREGANGLAFPNQSQPDREKVASLTAEILLAKMELTVYMCGAHPSFQHVSQFVPPPYRPTVYMHEGDEIIRAPRREAWTEDQDASDQPAAGTATKEKECSACFNMFPVEDMETLMYCQCLICHGCFRQYYEIVIKEKRPNEFYCPACQQPDMNPQDDNSQQHLWYLENRLGHMLDAEFNQMLQTKIRDWTLADDGEFFWCSHCTYGFAIRTDEIMQKCPSCKKNNCIKCNSKWEEGHVGRTCEEYQMYKTAQEAKGAKQLLQLNEKRCPAADCKEKFILDRGGCKHLTCPSCKHNFCEGCENPFKNDCGKFEDCAPKGFHAHHPRNCIYYLRDFDIQKLVTLLTDKGVEFQIEADEGDIPAKGCPVLEMKDTGEASKPMEGDCGEPVEPRQAGLCRTHYKEYLIKEINRHSLDPVDIMDEQQMLAVIQREHLSAPGGGTQVLAQFIKQQLVL